MSTRPSTVASGKIGQFSVRGLTGNFGSRFRVPACIAGRFRPQLGYMDYLRGTCGQARCHIPGCSACHVQLSVAADSSDLKSVVEHLSALTRANRFLKKGEKSVGVQRYSGTAGRIENCQAFFASRGIREFIVSPSNREASCLVGFRTKPQLLINALNQIRWVADEVWQRPQAAAVAGASGNSPLNRHPA